MHTLLDSAARFSSAFVRFSRPHTVIGTTVRPPTLPRCFLASTHAPSQLSIVSIALLCVQNVNELSFSFLMGLLNTISSALLANICIVGFNQLTDIDIDKVNKPYLPLASGEFSVTTGQALVAGSGLTALITGASLGFFKNAPV